MHKCRVNNKYTYFFIPNTGVALSFDNSVNVYQTTGYHITDDGNNHIHRNETLKSCTEIHRLHSYNAALTLKLLRETVQRYSPKSSTSEGKGHPMTSLGRHRGVEEELILIHKLSGRMRWVVSTTPRPLYPR
jgi:hypothetical protein